MHRISFDLRSYAAQGPVSTRVGDRLGTPWGAASFFNSLLLIYTSIRSLLPSSGHEPWRAGRPRILRERGCPARAEKSRVWGARGARGARSRKWTAPRVPSGAAPHLRHERGCEWGGPENQPTVLWFREQPRGEVVFWTLPLGWVT